MKQLLAGLCLFGALNAHAALVVTTSNDGSAIANNIIGDDVTVDVSSINYIGVDDQAGFFSGGISAGLGIDSGIILTSGNANLAVGPNAQTGASTNLGTAGSDVLDTLSGGNTNDANSLSFEFTTSTGDLFFNYILASEEYNEFLAFADPFALLVNGINIAQAPDGQIVSVGTVNCGSSGVDMAGPNCSSFNNNVNGTFDIEYDGFTDVFQASFLGLGAGTHTIEFVIADFSDAALDSAVFIEADSFSGTAPPISVSAPASIAGFGVLLAAFVSIRRKRTLV